MCYTSMCPCTSILMGYCVSCSNWLWGTVSLWGYKSWTPLRINSSWDPMGSENPDMLLYVFTFVLKRVVLSSQSRLTPRSQARVHNVSYVWYICIKASSITTVCLTDMQTSNTSIWRYHCLGEVEFLKIWNQYRLPSDTVLCSSPMPIFKLSLQVPWINSRWNLYLLCLKILHCNHFKKYFWFVNNVLFETPGTHRHEHNQCNWLQVSQ